ncbi:MAG: RNA-directed DNA polymerase [Bryobacter sp.]|nr:RNA-directed DNA polymerase [Bryobacter sp.]
MTRFELLTLHENLLWAWEKVRAYYQSFDGWFDELEVAEFELSLTSELKGIARDFARQRYRIRPLRPLPQPKRKDHEGVPQTRQSFWVSVRDQVAWTAYLNVIGPELDAAMPTWSYGNRLYRSFWSDDTEERPKLRIGRYRNASGQMYRPFRQSWPVYRRHVYLTVRKMAVATNRELTDLEPVEAQILESEVEDLSDDQKLPYLVDGYWNELVKNPYWASLDLEKFYPKVNLNRISSTIRNAFAGEPALVGRLLDDLLTFPVDLTGFTDKELSSIDLASGQSRFPNLPTGLMAAGFLSNVALLDVDRAVATRVKQRQVAHFRYVDDHLILARSVDDLAGWIADYRQLLSDFDIGTSFNPDKFEPKELGQFIKAMDQVEDTSELRKAADVKCRLDARFPTPLMTQTLAKVSDVARCDAQLLDDQELEVLVGDLQHLLLAEFPATELRPDTRVTFAAARLSRISAERYRSVESLVALRRQSVALEQKFNQLPKDDEKKAEAERQLTAMKRMLSGGIRRYLRVEKQDRARTLELLLKSLHEYPEKVRLWRHVLNFCRRSGICDLDRVFLHLDELGEVNQLAAEYVRASIFQILTQDLIVCAKIIVDPNALFPHKYAARTFLRSTVGALARLDGHRPNRFYGRRSWTLLLAGAGLAVAILEKEFRQVTPARWFTRLRSAASEVGILDWATVGLVNEGQTDYPLASLVWWAEQKTQSGLASEPGVAWQLAGARLSSVHGTSWTVWKLYPEAWADALPPTVVADRRAQRFLNKVGLSLVVHTSPARVLNLADWTDWTNKHGAKNPFDPRIGEWTCLEIAAQSARLVLEKNIRPAQIVPRNFVVPAKWTQTDYQSVLTWENWRGTAIAGDGLRLLNRGRSSDSRRESSHQSDPLVIQLDQIAAVALLLLGLLSRDFRWPAAWNPYGQRAMKATAARSLIMKTPCSSWTAAILEACLMPKQRESQLFSLFPVQLGTDDTRNDPPTIATLEHLLATIGHAQGILRRYQISVQDHEPRQMVPVSLGQLSNRFWTTPEAEE